MWFYGEVVPQIYEQYISPPGFTLQHTHTRWQRSSLLNHNTLLILDSFDILLFFCTTKPHWACIFFCSWGSSEGPSQKKREEDWGRKTKQILQHDAWGGEALQAGRLSFIFLPNWGEDFQTPSEAGGIPANREDGRRQRCQSTCNPKRQVQLYIYTLLL